MSDVDKPRLAIPSYDHAMSVFVPMVVDGMIGIEPMLGQIPVRVTGHSGPTRNVPGPQPVDHPLTTFKETFAIHADVIRAGDVETFVSTLAEMAVKYEDEMGKTLVRTLTDVTEAVGNAIHAQGRPLSWDLILDSFEKIEVSFDEDGRPHAMQIAMNPETAKLLRTLEITPEHRNRYAEIMQRKKAQWDAQKRTRRLPRKGQGTGV